MHHSPDNNKTKNWQFICTCTCELTVFAQPPYFSMCSIPSKMLRTHFNTLCDSKLLSFVSLSCMDPLVSPHRWIGKLKNPSSSVEDFCFLLMAFRNTTTGWHSKIHVWHNRLTTMQELHSQNKTEVLLASCNSTLTGRVVHHTCTCICILPISSNNRHTLYSGFPFRKIKE